MQIIIHYSLFTVTLMVGPIMAILGKVMTCLYSISVKVMKLTQICPEFWYWLGILPHIASNESFYVKRILY